MTSDPNFDDRRDIDSEAEADATFDEVVAQASHCLERGVDVDVESLAGDNPPYVARLRKLLPTLKTITAIGMAVQTRVGAFNFGVVCDSTLY